MVGYLIVWVFFAALLLLIVLLVLIQLVREGLARLRGGRRGRKSVEPAAPPPR